MTIPEQLEQILRGMKPMLNAQGKDVQLVEATDERIRVVLSGFCGGCGCSQDYVDSLREMMTEQFPQVKDIQLEVIG